MVYAPKICGYYQLIMYQYIKVQSFYIDMIILLVILHFVMYIVGCSMSCLEISKFFCKQNDFFDFIILKKKPASCLGSFQASVMVKGVDFESSSKGNICETPHEARNSAASNMLVKLRSMVAAS